MPTGTCRFPQHHGGPSAGPPVGLVLALIAGAFIIANLHAVIVTLAVVAVLAVLGAGVVMLVHSHRSEPYDATWAELEPRTESLSVQPLQARVVQLERLLAAQHAIEAPAQHLHLHGVTADDLAAIVAQRAAIGDYQATTAPHVNPGND